MAGDRGDGRQARRALSRQRIIEAAIQLATEQGLEPTADRVVELAGITPRTVFRHFEDMEALQREIFADFQAQSEALRVSFDPQRCWREQLDELVIRRTGIFERHTRHLLYAQAMRLNSSVVEADVQAYFQRMRKSLKQRLPAEFVSERSAFAAVEAVLGWELWLRLRRDQKLSVKQARAVVQNLVDAVLAQQGLG